MGGHDSLRRKSTRLIAISAITALSGAGLVATAIPANAVTVTVTTTTDDGAGSLREAITQVTGQPGNHTITLAPALAGQTITLLTPLEITNNVAIEGPANGATIAMNDDLTYFDVGDASEPNIVFHNLTLSASTEYAKVINNSLGNLSGITLQNVTVSGLVELTNTFGALNIIGGHLQSDGFHINDGTGDINVDGVEIDNTVPLAFKVMGMVGDAVFTNVTVTGASPTNYTRGFEILDLTGRVEVTDSNFDATEAILQVWGTDKTSSVLVENVQATANSNESIAIYINDIGAGGLTVRDVAFTGYATGVTLGYSDGPVTFDNVALDGKSKDAASEGVRITTLSPESTSFTNMDVTGYQTGMHLAAGPFEVMPDPSGRVNITDSKFYDLGFGGVRVGTFGGSINIERTLFDTIPKALESMCMQSDPGSNELGTLRISTSTFTDVMGHEGYASAVQVADCMLDVSNSTFSDEAASRDNVRFHFINLIPAWNATGVVARIAQSTFVGAGVLYSYMSDPADHEQIIDVSAVIADSLDAPGSVTTETSDLNLTGGRARVDSSLFSATQAELEATDSEATDYVWGSGNHFSVTAAQRDLGPLQDNSGPTPTRIPLTNSIAREAVAGTPLITPATTDQRGQKRVVGIQEIGAVELNPGTLSLQATQTVKASNNATTRVIKHPGIDAAYQAISGTVTFTPRTAAAGIDYTTAATHNVTLPIDTNQTTITIPTKAINNRGSKTLGANLTAGTNLLATPTTGTITITHPATGPIPTATGSTPTAGGGTTASTAAPLPPAAQADKLGRTGPSPALWLVLILGVLLTIVGTTTAIRARKNTF